MRLFILIAGILTALPHLAFAQITLPPAKPASDIVTVLSDGLSEPAGPASQVLSELSIALDKEGGVRLLSINGYGGTANVRDLLRLRGTDLAILNNDDLAYLDLAKALPEARKRVRLVAPLFNQSVFLFGRQTIKSISDLRGRKIGTPAGLPSRGVTARTVCGLLNIEAEFIELDGEKLAKKGGELDALLVYEQDLPQLRASGLSLASHHLLPLTIEGPLGSVYSGKKYNNASMAGSSAAEPFETIQVTTLMAAFDWSAKQGRYAEVVTFVNRFFSLVPQFRVRYPNSPFSRTDVRMNVPGWKRFGPAEPLAAAAPPVSIKEDNSVLPASAADTPPPADALRVIALARPPLTSEQDKDGGVALRILTGALSAAGVPVTVHWVYGERALLDGLAANKTADAGLFWQTPHCDTPSNQSAMEAEVCDGVVLTDPLMQAVIAVFTRPDMPLDPKSPDAAQTHTICMAENQPLPDEAVAAIPWIRAASAKIVRPKTLVDCLAAVDKHEADALIAIEPEARFAIEKLKLSRSFQISQRSSVTIGLHGMVAKDNPRQPKLIQIINEAVAKFRSSGAYFTVMSSHLTDLTGAAVKQP